MNRNYVKYPKKGDMKRRNQQYGKKGLVDTSFIGKMGVVRGVG